MSENKTPFAGLNQWEGNEYPKRVDFVDDNEKIDTALRILDETKAGAGELGDLADVITDGLAGISTELGDVGNIVTQVDTKVTDVQTSANDIKGKIGTPGDVNGNTLFGAVSISERNILNYIERPKNVMVYFNRPGQYTYNIPDGVTEILITAVGAGGGGGGGGGNYGAGGGGGGGGACVTGIKYTVSSSVLNFVVGAPGVSGETKNGISTAGSAGGATIIEGVGTFSGGGGGSGGGIGADGVGGIGGAAGGPGGGSGGNGASARVGGGGYGNAGEQGLLGTGGAGSNPGYSGSSGGGGGGGGSFSDPEGRATGGVGPYPITGKYGSGGLGTYGLPGTNTSGGAQVAGSGLVILQW